MSWTSLLHQLVEDYSQLKQSIYAFTLHIHRLYFSTHIHPSKILKRCSHDSTTPQRPWQMGRNNTIMLGLAYSHYLHVISLCDAGSHNALLMHFLSPLQVLETQNINPSVIQLSLSHHYWLVERFICLPERLWNSHPVMWTGLKVSWSWIWKLKILIQTYISDCLSC